MLLESVRSRIAEEIDLLGEAVPDDLEVYARATGEAVSRALPVALGVGLAADEHRLVVIGSDAAVMEAIASRAGGEADVYLVPVIRPRVTSSWVKQPHPILGIGRQVGPVDFGWVGTGGEIVRSADDPRVLLHVTNEHVVGEGAPRGRVMHQGGRSYGVVWKVGGLVFGPSQKWDVASIAIDRTRLWNATYDQGIDENLAGFRRMTPDDLGDRFTNTGQTIGTMFGTCIAVEIRDLVVGYDGGNGRFHDQAAFIGENGKPFSVGGHSGSLIVHVGDRHGCSRLFAGGPDDRGRDVTFGNADLPGAIAACGGVPEPVVP